MLLMVSQIYWSQNVEAILRKCEAGEDPDRDGMKKLVDYVVAQIDALVVNVRGKLTKLQRKTLCALITIEHVSLVRCERKVVAEHASSQRALNARCM